MSWLRKNEFIARPLVVVEDHVYHISELLRTIQSGSFATFANLTVVCLDRAGTDTDDAVAEWLSEYPRIQVATRVSSAKRFASDQRVFPLHDEVFTNQSVFCKTLAALIRKQGLVLQDIELETLEFIPRDRWWETTMLASTIRGILGDRPPKCAFISNKRGFEATFGAELLAAGHDPRDVLNKYELDRMVVPFINRYLAKAFPWELSWTICGTESLGVESCRVANHPDEQRDVLDGHRKRLRVRT